MGLTVNKYKYYVKNIYLHTYRQMDICLSTCVGEGTLVMYYYVHTYAQYGPCRQPHQLGGSLV